MNAITPFQSELGEVRVVDRGGEPWFVLADLCQLLGIRNTAQAARPLDDTERSMFNIGRQGDATIVSLAGALTLMVRCRDAMKPGTMPYRVRKWITAEVVPAVLRNGTYGQSVAALGLHDPAVLHRLLIDHTSRAMALDERVAALEPKAAALDLLAEARGSLCMTDAAKALAVPPRRLIAWLEANRWIYRRSDAGPWVAQEGKRQAGLVEHKGTRIEVRGRPDKWVEQVMVTPKGLARLAETNAGH